MVLVGRDREGFLLRQDTKTIEVSKDHLEMKFKGFPIFRFAIEGLQWDILQLDLAELLHLTLELCYHSFLIGLSIHFVGS